MTPLSEPGRATVHLQPCAGARTAFVFICPGRFEAQRGYPCAAGTGANLRRALLALHRLDPARFPSPERQHYLITNAWAQVEYPALTGRSVPHVDEVLQPHNLERLARELRGVHTVVACGVQAHHAMQALRQAGAWSGQLALARHLSQRSINTLRGASDTEGRIALWCAQVLGQLGAGHAPRLPNEADRPPAFSGGANLWHNRGL